MILREKLEKSEHIYFQSPKRQMSLISVQYILYWNRNIMLNISELFHCNVGKLFLIYHNIFSIISMDLFQFKYVLYRYQLWFVLEVKLLFQTSSVTRSSAGRKWTTKRTQVSLRGSVFAILGIEWEEKRVRGLLLMKQNRTKRNK